MKNEKNIVEEKIQAEQKSCDLKKRIFTPEKMGLTK